VTDGIAGLEKQQDRPDLPGERSVYVKRSIHDRFSSGPFVILTAVLFSPSFSNVAFSATLPTSPPSVRFRTPVIASHRSATMSSVECAVGRPLAGDDHQAGKQVGSVPGLTCSAVAPNSSGLVGHTWC